MNILRLEIENVRGIPHLLLEPNGGNVAIWGPNGSGKSAVIDAVDFLLTGSISRLTGKGAGELSLTKHGPHVGNKPEEAIVSATLRLPTIDEPVQIKRCMANAGNLEITCCEKDKLRAEWLLSVATKGQLVLARREILKYIHSEPRDRAEQIMNLLNLSEVENIRQAATKVKNVAVAERKVCDAAVLSAKGTITSNTGAKMFSEVEVLKHINGNRLVLGGKPLGKMDAGELLKGVRRPSDAGNQGISSALLQKDIDILAAAISAENKAMNKADDKELRESIAAIKANARAMLLCSKLSLFEQGIKLINEDGSCPLCDAPWEPGKLDEYLRSKVGKGNEYAEQNRIIKKSSYDLLSRLEKAMASLNSLLGALKKLGLDESTPSLHEWSNNLVELKSGLASPVNGYPLAKYDAGAVERMVSPENMGKTLVDMRALVKGKLPEATPELNAWSSLVQLGENLKVLDGTLAAAGKAAVYEKRATCLINEYVAARDAILITLYDDIRDRFVSLYRELHLEDESGFTATLRPKGAGLNFEVDFFGKGNHPPQALHSEGHQDSMGICLYLALAEKVNRGLMNLVLLDDVVMSVDTDHRRQLCQQLAKSFPGKQFIVTTHDRTWAMQLKSQGVVKSKQLIEFHNWNIKTGPQVDCAEVMWERIVEKLGKDDVHGAAGELRRGLEAFFSDVCDGLGGLVTYKASGRWELGDWCPSTISRYLDLLKKAKTSAQSWENDDALRAANENERIAVGIIERSNLEQWNLNAAVHYNGWENLSKKEFMPVVDAFHDLANLFVCGKCGEALRLAYSGQKPTNVRCGCGQENWNLVKKVKEGK